MATDGVDTLILRPLPLAEARSILAGQPTEEMRRTWHPEYPMSHTLDALALLISAYEAVGGPLNDQPPWWIDQMIMADQVVGDIGFHGPPSPEAPHTVEIGYCVVPAWRRRGVAGRACATIIERAWAQGVDVIMAETDADNPASPQVLRRNGFQSADGAIFMIGRP